MFKTDDPWIPT